MRPLPSVFFFAVGARPFTRPTEAAKNGGHRARNVATGVGDNARPSSLSLQGRMPRSGTKTKLIQKSNSDPLSATKYLLYKHPGKNSYTPERLNRSHHLNNFTQQGAAHVHVFRPLAPVYTSRRWSRKLECQTSKRLRLFDATGLSFTSLNFRGSCSLLSRDGSAKHVLLDSVCGVGMNMRIRPCMTSTRHMLVIFTSRRTAVNKGRTSHHAELDAHMNTSTPHKPSETKKRECHLRDPGHEQ